MTTDARLEAAAKAFWEHGEEEDGFQPWWGVSPATRERILANMAAALARADACALDQVEEIVGTLEAHASNCEYRAQGCPPDEIAFHERRAKEYRQAALLLTAQSAELSRLRRAHEVSARMLHDARAQRAEDEAELARLREGLAEVKRHGAKVLDDNGIVDGEALEYMMLALDRLLAQHQPQEG